MATVIKPQADKNHTGGQIGATVINPGDTVQFESGAGVHLGQQYFKDFIGTAANPITFDLNNQELNANGEHSAIRFRDCQHIRVISSGGRARLHNSANNVVLAELSPNFYMEHCEVYAGSSSGIRAGVQTVETTTEFWRSNFTEEYVHIKDCIVRNMTYEGIYIGNSVNEPPFWTTTGGVETPYFKSFITNVLVEDCVCHTCGYEPIQVGAAVGKAIVRNNEVYGYAGLSSPFHSSGIQMGEGTEGMCYNNYIHSPTNQVTGATGIAGLGQGLLIFNNLIISPTRGFSLYDRVVLPNKTPRYFHNTVVDAVEYAIHNQAKRQFHNKEWNNIYHMAADPSGVYRLEDQGGYADLQGNYQSFGAAAKTALFTNAAGGDYTLAGGSPAIAYCSPIKGDFSEIMVNYAGDLRPLSGNWDAGAY